MGGMRRLRILQIFSRYIHFGGEEGSVFRIGDALQQNHDAEYFIGSTNELLGGDVMDKISVPFRALYNLPVAQRLRRYQEVGNFDLWQVHNVLPGLSPSVYQIAFELKIPLVHYLHNYRMACTNGFFLNHGQPCERCLHGNFWPAFQTACWRDSHLISGMMGLILRRVRSIGTFQNTAAWIALSHSQKAKHVQMGIPEKRIHVIPHFYEPEVVAPPASPNGDVLFLGRLSPEKGVHILLQAWKLLHSGDRKLIIAGTGPEESKLRPLANALGLKNVEFTGFINFEDQKRYWSRSAFFVAPSIWDEPFGMVILEAWANARAVIGFKKGSFPELIADGIDGALALQVTPQALADKIQLLIDHPELAVRWGQAGFTKLGSLSTKAAWLSHIESVYETILPS
ncbi:MAG: glycosyltransferase family 1 protein [Verrucomicrobia bacterium]|nr:glycosyltransferase family 1 protein [Verrucomicrobiota bacterium]